MTLPLTNYVYTCAVGIAAFTSLISFRLRYPRHLQFFSILLLVTFGIEVASMINVLLHLKLGNLLYNIFVPLEMMSYAWVFRGLYRSVAMKRLTEIFIILFPIFAGSMSVLVFGIKQWNSFMMVGGCLFVVILASRYYYELFTSTELVKFNRTPEFWIATGMILLYSCQLPFFGALHYLVNNYLDLATDLMHVMQVVNAVMYLLFTYGYLCKISTAKSSLSS